MIDLIKSILTFITKKEVYGVVITLAIAYFVYRTIIIFLDEIINYGKNNYDKKKRKTVTNLFKNIVKYFILIVTLLVILSIYGINVAAMVAGLGVTATLIGLALQDTFKDIINGISIITENYFIVGDVVQYKTFIGEVVEYGLKSTKIKNSNGEIMIIANRNILEITNFSQKEQVVMLDIAISYEYKPTRIEKVINTKILPQISKIENVNSDSVKYSGIKEIAQTHIKYTIEFSCKRDKQGKAKLDANRVILAELEKENISTKY